MEGTMSEEFSPNFDDLDLDPDPDEANLRHRRGHSDQNEADLFASNHLAHESKEATLTDSEAEKKVNAITAALDPIDKEVLRRAAYSPGGFISDNVRSKAWAALLDIDLDSQSPCATEDEIKAHCDYMQVVMDVERTVKRFPPNITDERRAALMPQLTKLIMRVLLKFPELHYFQGYHDISITILLVAGEELGYKILCKLTDTVLRIHMSDSLAPSLQQLNLMFVIIGRENYELRRHIEEADLGPIYALSWYITWFSHDAQEYEVIVRLYDFFVAAPSIMPVYLSAAVTLMREKVLMAEPPIMSCLHAKLSKLNFYVPFEKLIQDAVRLNELYPPQLLQGDLKKLKRERPHWFGIVEPPNRRNKLTRRRIFTALTLSTAVLLVIYLTKTGYLRRLLVSGYNFIIESDSASNDI